MNEEDVVVGRVGDRGVKDRWDVIEGKVGVYFWWFLLERVIIKICNDLVSSVLWEWKVDFYSFFFVYVIILCKSLDLRRVYVIYCSVIIIICIVRNISG